MDIIVCIKQVPGSSNVKVDPATGVLIRDGVAGKMNPYDLYALELGLTLRERYGGSLKVVSMGPPAAMAVLNEAVWMGADGGVLISDRRLGGADVLATAYTISQAIAAMGNYDLVICGKQTTDGDTAQVGPEVAEFLKLPHAANVQSAEPAGDGRLRYKAVLDDKIMTAAVGMPCLICTDAEINTPRLPSYKRKKAAEGNDGLIKVISVDDFSDRDPEHYGLSGSATKVERIFPPEKNESRQRIVGSDDEMADGVFGVLLKEKYI